MDDFTAELFDCVVPVGSVAVFVRLGVVVSEFVEDGTNAFRCGFVPIVGEGVKLDCFVAWTVGGLVWPLLKPSRLLPNAVKQRENHGIPLNAS